MARSDAEHALRAAPATRQLSRWVALMGAMVALVLVGAGVLVPAGEALPAVAAGGGVIAAALLAATLWVVHSLTRPVDQLARDLAIIARDNPRHGFRLPRRHAVGQLAAAAAAVRDRLASADERAAADLAAATAELDRRQRQLEAILLDLTEGVVVCDRSHRVLLYNQAAADAIDPPTTLGLGRSLLACLTEEPIAHHLERLSVTHAPQAARSAPFVCGTVHGGRLLQARMSLMRDAEDGLLGYVLTFNDMSSQLRSAEARDDLLMAATEGQRALLANLRAAAETLAAHDVRLEPAQRAAFEQVILEESGRLSARLDELAQAHRQLGAPPWAMAEVYSSDLIAALTRRLEGAGGPQVTPTGLPQWLLGDSLALRAFLEGLARHLQAGMGIEALDAAVTPAGPHVELDLVWQGTPVPPDELEAWLDEPLTGGLGTLTGRAVLLRHGTDAWSQSGRRKGEALLRLPLPAAQPVMPLVRPGRPARPEFYDFDLLARPLPESDLAGRPLAELSYVVFDLETTGLKPSAGDRPVALGAVRVVNGRVLTMETFERLIDPGRPIPPESISFHGITDDMVEGKPPFELILPHFHGFAAGSVLVAHNAAFEMAFLDIGAQACGLTFDQPVLDTLLLSEFLDGPEEQHTLDGLAARYGLTLAGRRHAALADALLTAAVLVRQIERLATERGLIRLEQLLAATEMLVRLRANRAQF